MQQKKHHPLINFFTFLIFFLVLLLHCTGIDISVKNATPLIILPLITAFSMFNSTPASVTAGLLAGIFMDSIKADSICFNAIILILCSAFVSVSSNCLFNKNIFSAILLSVIISFIYFLIKWLVFYTFKITVHDNLTYILKYALPSIIYTNIFIFPLYYLFKFFNKTKLQ